MTTVVATSKSSAMALVFMFTATLLAAIGASASPTAEIPHNDNESTDELLSGVEVNKDLGAADEVNNHGCPGNAGPDGELSKTRYYILGEVVRHAHDETTTSPPTTQKDHSDENLNTWSVAWYLTLLGAFIIFFILIGLTEIFCRRRARESRWHTARRDGQLANQAQLESAEPPPSYDLFKPPSYSTLFPPELVKSPRKAQDDSPPQHKQLVYVVSLHGSRGVS